MGRWPFLYKGMLIVPLNGSYAIHVHHWMVYLPLAIFALMTAKMWRGLQGPWWCTASWFIGIDSLWWCKPLDRTLPVTQKWHGRHDKALTSVTLLCAGVGHFNKKWNK